MAAPGQTPSAAPPLPVGMTAIPLPVVVPAVPSSSMPAADTSEVESEAGADKVRWSRRAAAAGVAEQARLAAQMKAKQAAVPPPAAFTIPGACAYSGMNRTALYLAIGDGRITALKLGRRTLILRASIDAMLANLPTASIRVRKQDAPQ